jgi:hypothetical protein
MKQQENDFEYKTILKVGYWRKNFSSIDTKILINYLYKIQQELPSTQNSNIGGYQSPPHLNFRPEFSSLVNFLNSSVFNLTGNPNLKIISMWGNISHFTDSNDIHTHTTKGYDKNSLSGILYLNTPPNSGNLILYNPLSVNNVLPVTPKEKDLILFPSFLSHSVEVNLSQEDRISIAFNFE